MKRVCQHLVDPANEATALQMAKLAPVRQFGDQTRPIYWAGFTLVGDGSAEILEWLMQRLTAQFLDAID
jgi:CHAT domain